MPGEAEEPHLQAYHVLAQTRRDLLKILLYWGMARENGRLSGIEILFLWL
jgi:hypothetical protein